MTLHILEMIFTADIKCVHILLSELNCKKCISIYGQTLEYDLTYYGLGPNSGLKNSELLIFF